MLPQELFRPIIEEIQDRPTLYALSLSTKAIYIEAQRILYRTIPLQDQSNFRLHLYFLTTINQNPQLALHVHEYHSYSMIDYHENPGWSLSKKGLENMVNLKELSFRAVGGHPSCDLLESCTFQLDRLTWSNRWDIAMIPFLAGQSLLTYLDINCTLGTEFSANVCPNLKELRGNIGSLIAFLPGRSITTVDWTIGPSDLVKGISRLLQVASSELKKICTLTMRGASWNHYHRIADQLPSIETLMTYNSSIMDLMNFPIHNFIQLKHCIVTFGPEILQHDHPSFVVYLFSNYPNLKIVDISKEVLNGRLWYRRWIYGIVYPQLIIPDQLSDRDTYIGPQ